MFMHWIVCTETTSQSKVHIFSTYFYSILRDEGVNAVSIGLQERELMCSPISTVLFLFSLTNIGLFLCAEPSLSTCASCCT